TPDAIYDAELAITWAHRDRLQQTSGVLVDHTEADIGPEAGTVYRVQGYVDNVLVHTEDDIDGTSAVWLPTPGDGRVEVHAKRDGLYSWQAPSHTFFFTGEVIYPQFIPVPGGPLGEEDAGVWTSYQSGLPTPSSIGYVVSATAARPWWGQVIDIPSKFWDDIDAGTLQFNAMWRPDSWSGDSDASSLGIDCLAEDFTY